MAVAVTPNSASSDIRGYQYTGRFLFPAVKAKHQANLAFVLDDLAGWEQAMLAELAAPRHRDGWIRIHDSGDFFSDEYLAAWLRIIRQRPNLTFYCYTKEIERFRRLVEVDPPGQLPVDLQLRRYPGR